MSEFKVQEILNFRQLFFLDKFLMGHHGFIAGGCFKNIFNKEKVKDIDMFFESNADFNGAVKYFKDLIINNPDEYKKSYENKNVWAVYSIKDKLRIELIKSVFGRPDEIIQGFDFSITKFAYYRNLDNVDEEDYMAQFEVIYHEDYFEHLQMKRLVLDDEIPFPVSTFNRSYKYQSYGYGLCKESKIKLIEALRDIDKIDKGELSKSLYEGKD